jgi:hypothetical protein
MAFANPLVLTVNAVAKSLAKINQDNYGSEYYLRESTQEFRVKIRHSEDKAIVGSGKIHRSNVTVTQTIFAVAPAVLDNVRQISYTVTNGKADTAVDVGYLGAATSALLAQARIEDLVGWLN